MEAGAFKLLESATQRTLHAHAFTRSSSQASLVLTDLLSRYLTLLTSTCAKYAQHSGRTTMNVRDAVASLEELGVSLHELNEYCATEGKELNRYALYSARRVEDLLEFKSQVGDGLRQDKDDAILLEYTRCPTPLLDSDEEEASGEEDVKMGESSRSVDSPHPAADMDVDQTSPTRINALPRKRPPARPSTPPLPLSPISNPSSPKRKRPRRSDWEPPEYIPDFLPPFPSVREESPGSPVPDQAPAPLPQPSLPTLTQISDAAAQKTAMTLSQSLTTAAASDFFLQVPYSQSSLASVSEWHLPSALPPAPPVPQQHRQNANLPTLQLEHSLLGAYHHILTHPPPRELPPLNPPRHKVAMSLIKQGQANPRYNPADTLFASVAPCPPRMATIGPTYPIPIGETPINDKGKEKDVKLPQSIPRTVAAIERIAPFITQQTSQIPSLALRILPPAIHARTSRLSHPPVLHRGSKALTYGPGIPAPWNSNQSGQDSVVASGPLSTKDGNAANGKDSGPKPLLPDARLYATWDYETKGFRVPLAPSVRARPRMGSLNVQSSTGGGSGLISLPVGTRTKATK